ncbi:50S ribosomal protein L24 [Spiroplasma endosymbiont of Aspidapion aeneum]|uniref:50S ribosomal protein L24 n=1 Tax=Spiroplasma endosymbiont of Aspidapion aeneum TaxID=3066276 RepID=UPI00313D62DB
MNKTKFVTGDIVKITTGKHKGEQGPIIKFSKDRSRVFVEGIKGIKHQKPSQQSTEGGIIDIEKAVHISNVQLVDPKNKDQTTRIAYSFIDGKKKRITVKSKAILK